MDDCVMDDYDGWTHLSEADRLCALAWGIIANAGEGDWTREAPGWQEAAVRWREQYHHYLASLRDE